MSFILDALRKSEHERQRNRAPGIADMRAPQKERNRGLWIPLVALLAGLNLALLAVLWFMGDDKDAPETSQAAAQSSTQRAVSWAESASTGTQQNSASLDSQTRSLSAELEAPSADEMQDPARFASISPPVTQTAPATNRVAATTANSERMLTVTEAMLDGSLSITPLHLDIHVYSDVPTERFIFINTSRYGEGERISEGPTVSAINKQGVILNYQGRDYLLARD